MTVLVLGSALPLAAGASQPAGTLADTQWVLTEYAVQRSAPVPAVGEQRPTLVFGADGRVTGTTGCNSFNGPYQEAADELTMGPLASTLRACVDDNLARQEQLMQRVLNGKVLAARPEANKLTLSAPAGMLVFAAANIQNQQPAPAELPSTGGPTLGLPARLLLLATLAAGLGLAVRRRADEHELARRGSWRSSTSNGFGDHT